METADISCKTRSAFLLVRALADLERVSPALSAYLMILRRHVAEAAEALLGIWVDDEDVADLPCALTIAESQGLQRTFRVLESTGINCIWMLCWLEEAAGSPTRAELAAALWQNYGDKPGVARAPRFIPVYSNEMPESSVHADAEALAARCPDLLLPPIHLDSSGRLILPIELLVRTGSTS